MRRLHSTAKLITAMLLAATLLACGNNRITIDLDLESFVPEEDKNFDYMVGAVDENFRDLPFLPDELIDELPEQVFETDSGIIEVAVPSGINDITELKQMTFTVGLSLNNRQLTAAEIVAEVPEVAPYIDMIPLGVVIIDYEVRNYISADNNPNQFWTPANEFLPITGRVVGDAIGSESLSVDGAEFLDLFSDHETLYVGTRVTMRAAAGTGTGVVEGLLTITEMDMHIDAETSGF